MTTQSPVSLSRGERLDRQYGIAERLGLSNNPDQQLVQLYLEQRLLRRDLYQTSSLLHSRIGVALTHFPFLRWLGRIVENQDRINRSDESSLTSDIDKYIAEQYTTPEQRRRARTIELAINNLAARATYSETPTIKPPEFRPTEEMLSIWATYWRTDPLLRTP